MAKKYDVIVISSSHNGLVNAAYLAKAGKKVLVLEKRYILGSTPSPKKSSPDFEALFISYVVWLLRRKSWANMNYHATAWKFFLSTAP